MRTLATVSLSLLTLVSAMPAQKPAPSGWVGKALPEIKGHDGSDSTWLGRAPAALDRLNGKMALVVLTSYD